MRYVFLIAAQFRSARWIGLLVIVVALGPFVTAQRFCPAGMVSCDMDGAADALGGPSGCDLACAAVLESSSQPVPTFVARVKAAAPPIVLLAKGYIPKRDLRPPISISNL